LAGVILISGAFAFLSDSESAINRFTFADKDGEQTVDVEIIEPSWEEVEGKDILPLDTVAKDPQVVNDGENDVYSFVTVLVPTAKEITLNNDDGTTYKLNNVELFRYSVNNGWTEIAATKYGVEDAHKVSTEDGRKLILNTANLSIIKDLGANVYYTAHTYAYAASDAEMTRLGTGETTTPVFDSVTLINIADGARVYETLEEVLAKLVPEDGTTVAINEADRTIEATTASGSTVIFKEMTDEDGNVVVVDTDANIQYKVLSQFVEADNLNIYVDTYAIQADNIEGSINEVWDICANANAGVAEGSKYTSEFYFEIINNDIGHKSALA
jgi:hypothetical protein